MTDRSTSYAQRTPLSRGYFERAQRSLPGGVSYAIRDVPPHPFYVDRAAGSRLYDVDGHEYTDYWCGHGALVLGHAHPAVTGAAVRQVERGSHLGFAHPLEVEMAETVRAMVPGVEMIRYTNSGTEANQYAAGLARAFTGRRRIVKMEGGWHGGVEALNKGVHAPFTAPEAAGLHPGVLADTGLVPFNDLDAARAALAGHDVASLIVEPILGAAGFIPAEPGYLAGLRDLCRAHGTLLVFDEVITGFRLAPGGAQQRAGSVPDITILGKVMGGGFPIGAVGGRADVIARFDHRLFPARADRPFHGGTFSANPVSMAAGLAALAELRVPGVYARLERLGDRARRGLQAAFADNGIAAAVTGAGSMLAVHFRAAPPRNAREAADADHDRARALFDFLLGEGIAYLTPDLPHMFLSAAHAEADVDRLVDLAAAFARGDRR